MVMCDHEGKNVAKIRFKIYIIKLYEANARTYALFLHFPNSMYDVQELTVLMTNDLSLYRVGWASF